MVTSEYRKIYRSVLPRFWGESAFIERQAIEYINKNDVDVVITDVRMSDIDGFELL